MNIAATVVCNYPPQKLDHLFLFVCNYCFRYVNFWHQFPVNSVNDSAVNSRPASKKVFEQQYNIYITTHLYSIMIN